VLQWLADSHHCPLLRFSVSAPNKRDEERTFAGQAKGGLEGRQAGNGLIAVALPQAVCPHS
jgi:hypothetical protein